ncbi:MAG TPA: M20/M25/M40 family metallo-hydrolase, partial [bacterium]|nr:M20/M25/M40 family metallo-hydrolase [bacterium]
MSNISMQIARLAESLSTSIANFLADIVSIPSLSGDEKRVVERIGHEMKAVGFDEVRVDGLGSVIGRIGSGKKIIAMDAHIDTVDVGTRELWDFDPFDGHVKGGKVWGRGAADQKGGIASLVYAGKIIKELGL